MKKLIKKVHFILLLLVFVMGMAVHASAASATWHTLATDGNWLKTDRITATNDLRYYEINLKTSGYLTVDVRSLTNGLRYRFLDEDINIIQSKDTVLWGASESVPKSLSWSMWLEPGTYYVDVYKYSKETGPFWLKASFEPAGNQETEPNQTYANPTSLTLGREIRGLLSIQDKHDYYTFYLPKAQKVTLRSKCYFPGPRFRVYDADLTQMRDIKNRNDVAWGGSPESPTIFEEEYELSAGKYYVYVDQYGSSQGLYDLKVSGSAAAEEVKLPAATGFKAQTIGMNKVQLTWNKVTGADGYLIVGLNPYRSGSQIGYTTGATSWIDNSADSTSWNYYWVIPYKKGTSGNVKGATSDYAYAMGRVVGKVAKVTAKAGAAGISLSWSKVQGANAYVILSKTDSNRAPFNKPVIVKGTSYIDRTIASGRVGYYWVYGVYNNAAGVPYVAGLVSPFAWAVAK